MALISNRHYKVVIGSLAIFVIFVFLLTQPSGVNQKSTVNKPTRLDTPNTVLISDKAPYSKTGAKKVGEDDASVVGSGAGKDTESADYDDVAPIKDTKLASGSKLKPPAANKIQANKDKSESAEEGKLAGLDSNKDVDVPTGSSSFGDDSELQDPTQKQSEKIKVPGEAVPSAAAGSSAGGAGAAVVEPIASGNCKDKVEYVVMIDAGSTGSRVHIYSFDLCYSPPKLLNEEFKMLKPGLSSFDTDTVGAAKSLDPLLELALETVPEKQRSCTPVAVKATAGLRLLGQTKSDAILAEVRRHLEEDYPFAVVDDDGVSIMQGSDEGVYAWITTNYLLGNIGSATELPTAAVFDLGGGSTQIVFEPKEGEKMIEGEHKYKISFGGRDFTLYQYSHLGYGLMEGRNKINSLVLQTYLETDSTLKPLTETELASKDTKASVTISHPCIPPGVTADNVKVKTDKSTYLVNFKSPASTETDPLAQTEGTQCRFLAESVLNKELECKTESCSFNGIYQPSLLHQFDATNDMFIFSYFYDRLNPLGMPNSFTLDEITEVTKLVCSGSKFWSQYFSLESSVAELKEEPQWCLDLSFMVGLLHTGYDIPLARELKTAKKINDNELGWCLGASLPLLDKDTAGWKCKVEEIAAKV